MNILKNAMQKNFEVETGWYTEKDLREMMEKGLVIYWGERFQAIRNFDEVPARFSSAYRDDNFRVFTDSCKEILVRYDRTSGSYKTVAVCTDGTEIVVRL